MTLDEAIIHAREKAKELRDEYDYDYDHWNDDEKAIIEGRIECANAHEQLAAWLEELKDYREGLQACENCRYECKTETEYSLFNLPVQPPKQI